MIIFISRYSQEICYAFAFTLASGVLLAENTADFTNRVGTIRPSLHSAGYIAAFSNPSKEYADALLKDLNFAYSRTHDWALADGVLTLPKPKGSAVFLVTFAIPEEEGL